jgi:hypothetical protein
MNMLNALRRVFMRLASRDAGEARVAALWRASLISRRTGRASWAMMVLADRNPADASPPLQRPPPISSANRAKGEIFLTIFWKNWMKALFNR